MLMTSPKVIEGMYKQNPKGFIRMLDKMYPNERRQIRQRRFYFLGEKHNIEVKDKRKSR